MAYNKIGFHFGSKSAAAGWGEYVRSLDAAGVPAVCMSMAGEGIGDIVALWDAGSTVAHVVVVRYMPPGGDQDVPPYGSDPRQAATDWWSWQKPLIGPDVRQHKDKIVIKMGNELDKNRAEWLASFYIELYQLMQNDPDGPFRLGAFGFASGEPEPAHWRGPRMLDFLRICADDPVGAGIVLHEYSYADDLISAYNHQIGRFLNLFRVCDENGLERPSVYIHEWGWRQDTMPSATEAMAQIPFAAGLYAAFTNVKGAGIWTLQGAGNYGNINKKAQLLILPIRDYSLKTNFLDPDEPDPPPQNDDCAPRVPYARTYLVAPQDATLDRWLEICAAAFPQRNTVSFSYDDAGHAPGTKSNTAVLYDIPPDGQAEFLAFYEQYYPETAVQFVSRRQTAVKIELTYRPCQTQFINQKFGANPANYAGAGLPGHDGLDYAVVKDAPFYAAAGGAVVHASDRRWSSDSASNYGWHVVIDHGDYCTVYAHARPDLRVKAGQQVAAGQIVGYSGNTGNSTGYHLHFGILDKTDTIDPNNGFPDWKYGRCVDPWPWVEGKPAPTVPAHLSTEYSGPGVSFAAALHQPGSDWMWQQKPIQDMFLSLGLPVKWLSDGVNADYYTKFNKSQFHLVRLNWKTGVYRTPAEAWSEIRDGALRFYSRGARKFELLNEPNLPQEGLGVVWDNGDSFGRWLADFATIARAEMPQAQFYFPGMSPGVPWTNQFVFTNAAWPHVAQHCYGVCLHAYTGVTNNVDAAVTDIVKQVKEAQAYKWLDRPMIVSEASVNRSPSGVSGAEIAAYKAAVYRGVERELAKIPGIESVVWFISHWDAPPEQKAHKESWLELGLAGVYKVT